MVEHMEGKCKMQFMGTHDLMLIADADWDETGKNAMIDGVGKLKIIKWLVYQFSPTTHGWKDDDGTIHFEGGQPVRKRRAGGVPAAGSRRHGHRTRADPAGTASAHQRHPHRITKGPCGNALG